MTLKIYATQTCPQCTLVEKLFKIKNISYEKIYIDDEPEIRQELINKTGFMKVPITTNGDKYIVGYNPAQLLQLIQS